MVDDLSVLGGTPHADCINLVHLELSNMVNTSETLVVNSKAVVCCLPLHDWGAALPHVPHMPHSFPNWRGGNQCPRGSGRYLGWGVAYNISMRVLSNTVNKRTSELWAILIAARTAIARGFPRLIVSSENYSFTPSLMQWLRNSIKPSAQLLLPNWRSMSTRNWSSD